MNSTISPISASEPSANALFALLGDPRRRTVLLVLAQRGSAAPLDDLAEAVAARETGTEEDEVPADTTTSVGVTLHHHHLPKLDHANVVDYDSRTRTAIPVQVEEMVDHLTTHHDRIEDALPSAVGPRNGD